MRVFATAIGPLIYQTTYNLVGQERSGSAFCDRSRGRDHPISRWLVIFFYTTRTRDNYDVLYECVWLAALEISAVASHFPMGKGISAVASHFPMGKGTLRSNLRDVQFRSVKIRRLFVQLIISSLSQMRRIDFFSIVCSNIQRRAYDDDDEKLSII